jgi:hypothetical protein
MKPARGWTWADGDEILRAAPECPDQGKATCEACAISRFVEESGLGMCGLIWVGETHYPTPRHFNNEADRMGISRRINSVPRDFVIGETVVMLAHRRAILKTNPAMGEEIEYTPGIFRIFKPTHIEIVVNGDEETEVIDGYIKRNLTPVVIERVEDQQEELIGSRG